MIYVFNKRKLYSCFFSMIMVIFLFMFSIGPSQEYDIKVQKVSTNAVENTTNYVK